MKQILLFLSIILPATAEAQDITEFLNWQITQYPKSHLIDIYKSAFQDAMGPEHIIRNPQMARNFLSQELSTEGNELTSDWLYEPCGVRGRFVRVSLCNVINGYVTEEQLYNAFIRSANEYKRPNQKSWKRQWKKIISTIDMMKINLPDYDKEKLFIDSILDSENYAVSHSDEYRLAYHPHYRIIRRDIFEKEIKTLISRQTPFIQHQPIHHGYEPEHSPNVFLLMYDPEVGKEPLLKAIREYKCEIVYDYNIITCMALKKPEDKTLEETMKFFKTVKGVTNVEYDNIIRLTDPVKPKMELK